MKLSPLEAGNYYRGLLLLIRKDNKVTEEECFHLKNTGKTLGFEKLFCETAINDILENQHISKAPPLFSKIKFAKKFISDGFLIACCDNDLHPKEEQWLRSVADKNGIEEGWFVKEREKTERLQKRSAENT